MFVVYITVIFVSWLTPRNVFKGTSFCIHVGPIEFVWIKNQAILCCVVYLTLVFGSTKSCIVSVFWRSSWCDFFLTQISWEQFFNLPHSLCSVINMINVSIWDWSLHVACKLDNCKLQYMYMQNCIGSRHTIKISIRDQKLIINHKMLDQINSSPPPILLVFWSLSVQYVHKHGAHSVRYFVQNQHDCMSLCQI